MNPRTFNHRRLSQKLRRFRLAVMKVHRRAGVAVVLFAIFLTVTGVLINHSNALGWDKERLASIFWLQLYGVTLQPVENGFELAGQWVSNAGGRLMIDEQVISECAAPLSGVVKTTDAAVALCNDSVVLFTSEGQLIEKMPLVGDAKKGLGIVGDGVVSREQDALVSLDTLSGQWAPYNHSSVAIQWSQPTPLPMPLAMALQFQNVPEDLTWERLLLDLHSGRLFGNAGVLAVDVMGLLIMSLAITGLWVALTRKR